MGNKDKDYWLQYIGFVNPDLYQSDKVDDIAELMIHAYSDGHSECKEQILERFRNDPDFKKVGQRIKENLVDEMKKSIDSIVDTEIYFMFKDHSNGYDSTSIRKKIKRLLGDKNGR